MRIKLFLLSLLLLGSCATAVKESPSLLDYVPQNSLAVFQLNDQNMIENAHVNLPFLAEIVAID